MNRQRLTLYLSVSLLAVMLSLSGCDDKQTVNNTLISDPEAAIAQARQEAVDDEAASLWQLEDQRDDPLDAEARAAINELSRRQMARVAGDYSFEPPPPPPVSRPGQLLNIPAVSSPRFTVSDRNWSATVGELNIAMWSQDKLAAFSLSIDDNHVQDHTFWQDLGDQYGWRWTWFVIANQTGWASHDHWGHWQAALDKGHDIQTHTYSHLCDALFYTYREYRQSQAVINQNLDGAKVVTMAYPFGMNTNKTGSPCEPLDTERTANSRDEAAKHFLAVRDVYGALSHPGRIDYLKVPSVSAARNFFNAAAHWANFDTVLNPGSANFRTWYVTHFHGLYGDDARQYVQDVLAHVKSKENDVWVGTFTEVAKYGQEYATAALSNIQVGSSDVRFELKDQMNDSWFDQPLTVKLRLPDGWSGTLNATQGGVGIPVRPVLHNSQAYALIDAVPDRGLVIVSF
ncbi:MAG: polysaccharide deacetylase family protein [Thiolinea sp.]